MLALYQYIAFRVGPMMLSYIDRQAVTNLKLAMSTDILNT
jgi:hypothetical protein